MRRLLCLSLILLIPSPCVLAADVLTETFPAYDQKSIELNLKRHHLFKAFAQAMGEASDPDSGADEAGRVERNMRLFEKKWDLFFIENEPAEVVTAPLTPSLSAETTVKTRNFIEKNLSKTLMPLSFEAPDGYWRSFKEPLEDVDRVIERTLVQNSLNIYDGALWQIALTLFPSQTSQNLVDRHTRRLISGEAGDISNLRGSGGAFSYGGDYYDRDNAFFFRMITDSYLQEDPLGQNEIAGFPNFNRVHHEDWKPITGEQAWAAIIGPLQTAYKRNASVSRESPEVRLALSVLSAMESMQSPIGALYHAPAGTFGIHPNLISVENNLSVYAALGMLEKVLDPSVDPEYERVKQIRDKIERFLMHDAYDRTAHEFYSSGFYLDGRFVPGKLFASDCQSWAVLALGPEWIERNLGPKETLFLWNNLLSKAAIRDLAGNPVGVSFTSDKAVISVEWTCGAILAGKKIAAFYRPTDPALADTIENEARSMRLGIEKFKSQTAPDSEAYWYSSRRYFIPFGWWANPIPSLASSAWILFADLGFNPLILGG